MTAALPEIADRPGPDETVCASESVALLDRELVLTAAPDMVVVRVFGTDDAGNAVRIGTTPERAMRLAAAFIRAALRIRPALRLQLIVPGVEDGVAAEGDCAANLKIIAGGE